MSLALVLLLQQCCGDAVDRGGTAVAGPSIVHDPAQGLALEVAPGLGLGRHGADQGLEHVALAVLDPAVLAGVGLVAPAGRG